VPAPSEGLAETSRSSRRNGQDSTPVFFCPSIFNDFRGLTAPVQWQAPCSGPTRRLVFVNLRCQNHVDGFAVPRTLSAFHRHLQILSENWLAQSRGSSCMSSVIRAPEAKRSGFPLPALSSHS
jgi:hypothetical protein